MFILNLLLTAFTLLLYAASGISPEKFWPAGFLSFLIPACLVVHLIFILFWLFINPLKCLVSAMAIALGAGFIQSSFSFHLNSVPEDGEGLKVLSYNTRVFNTYAHLKDKDLRSSKEILRFLLNSEADVICLQEFYNDDKSKVFNTVRKLTSKKYPYYFITNELVNTYGAQFGIALFSKYPILHKGNLKFSEKTKNQAMFADIRYKRNTIRVYNLHLQSMSINENHIIQAEWDERSKKNMMNIAQRLKRGMIDRSRQLRVVLENMKECPYKIILCGDLNDTPYTYTYRTIKSLLNNSFEEAGLGFGFTYNGRLPFLRIDNQFADKKIKVRYFNTHTEVPYTDHFPVSAVYEIR